MICQQSIHRQLKIQRTLASRSNISLLFDGISFNLAYACVSECVCACVGMRMCVAVCCIEHNEEQAYESRSDLSKY